MPSKWLHIPLSRPASSSLTILSVYAKTRLFTTALLEERFKSFLCEMQCSYSNKLLSGWWLIWLYNNFTMDMLWEGVTQQTIVKLCLDLRHVTTDHWPHDGVTELTLTWDMVTVGSWHHIRYQLLPTAAADPCTYHAPQSSVSQYYLLLHWQTLINASE